MTVPGTLHSKLQSRLLGETLRDQWIALLESLDNASTVVQLESMREEQFYCSEEVLAD